jgi:hypothetical protein
MEATMSDNPLEMTPEREALIGRRARELHEAAGGVGKVEQFREQADELVRMEQAGATGQLPVDAKEFVEEASIQENLGEFPGGSSVADQGEWRETPMTRDELDHPDADAQPGHGDTP